MSGKIVILRKDAGADQFLLQRGSKIQKVLRCAAADVVDRVGGEGQPVFAGGSFRRALHDPDDAFHNVVHIGEVPPAVAVVEDLNLLAGGQFLRCREVEHIRTSCGAVDREEAQPGRGNAVEL